MRKGLNLVWVLPVALAAATIFSASVSARPSAPGLLSPGNGATFQTLPPFSWRAVPGADRYEFEIAADAGFASPVPGTERDQFATRNTRGTFTKTVPNGTYYWRVRAITKGGVVSAWSSARAVRRSWSSAPRLEWPTGGTSVQFPKTPLTLRWSPVAYAAKYLVSLSTDPHLGSLIGGRPIETAATSFTPPLTPAAKETYFWSVTPVDAAGNRGAPSAIGSFKWSWPTSDMHPKWRDLRADPETFDPQFSWDAVAGAARYDVEINPSVDFAPGSKVCCTTPTIATSLSPRVVYRDNTYYWRVRAIDADGNAGAWNVGEPFTKVFDRAAQLGGVSIKNLRLRDNVSASLPAGAKTQVPVVAWDPVPGASSYYVEVVPQEEVVRGGGLHCNWQAAGGSSGWSANTAVSYWTPLGAGSSPPYPGRPSHESDVLRPGLAYCVRVRARSDRDSENHDVAGDFTYLNAANDSDTPGFVFGGYPCVSGCTYGYLSGGGYNGPTAPGQSGAGVTTTPLLTWQPEGHAGFYVVVAKDPDFHSIVDYAFTNIPAYAPRTSTAPVTYPDETTKYYWAVLPAQEFSGRGAPGDPLHANAQSFDKRSIAPNISFSRLSGSIQPAFCWTAVEGARRYRVQVSQDASFGDPIDDVTTDSVCYSSSTSYPADVQLYWRVRAEDENKVGLTWSDTGKFQQSLPAPRPAARPASGETLPTWRWDPVTGAAEYDIHVELPNGTTRDFHGISSAAVTPIKMTGTGIFHWKVRAEFPKGSGGLVPGPYSKLLRFTRTIGRPSGARVAASARSVLFSWAPRLGVESYRLEVSSRPDFSGGAQTVITDATAYAPTLMEYQYRRGGRFYWRVAAEDADGNRGNWTEARSFRLPMRQG